MSTLDQRFRLLMIDDDPLIHASVKLSLPDNWELMAFTDLPEELPIQTIHAAFVDMHLTGNIRVAEGLTVIEKLHQRQPHLEIIAISGNLDRQLMESCLKAGATRFLAKPLHGEEVRLLINKIENLQLLRRAQTRRQTALTPFLGTSRAAEDIRRQIAELSGEPGPILIEGETGSGKEVVAQLLHSFEPTRPFISVNTSAIPENLFESEFFGHLKGSFTGADQNKMGLVEAAQGGDLFLDEIEALPLTVQPKLLRFLESGEVRRIGARDSTNVHVRILAATNESLEKLVAKGRFREDLLWRLKGRSLRLPPLRDRVDDIAVIAKFFLENIRPQRQKVLSEDALLALRNYPWPGNIRELKRVCEQLSVIAPLPIIRGEDIGRALPRPSSPKLESVSHPSRQAGYDLQGGLAEIIARLEADIIQQTLHQQNDVDEAAKILQISRSSLYKKIKEYQILIHQ